MVKLQGMKKLIQRLQMQRLEQCLKRFPIVAVLGARQTGKTTLVRDLLNKKRAYYSFDDQANILIAEQDPVSFLTQSKYMTIDEVQKVPSILPAMKKIVDEKRLSGQFLITGSANITMLPNISETLAGRIVFIDLPPLTMLEVSPGISSEIRLKEILRARSAKKCWEVLGSITPVKLPIEKYVLRGGLPPAFLNANHEMRNEWFIGYVRTYLERDVRDLSRIQRLHEYQKYLSLLSLRTAQIFNKSEVARDCGVPYTTSGHFLDLLITTFQVFLLQPFFSNVGKRHIKSPKLMWNDTGLSMNLQGLRTWKDAIRLCRDGALVENKVAIELKTYLRENNSAAKLFYWRTSGGAEIDFVIESNHRIIPVEVKWSSVVRPKSLTAMQMFLNDYKERCSWGIVLYKGQQLIKMKKNVFLVPFDVFFQ